MIHTIKVELSCHGAAYKTFSVKILFWSPKESESSGCKTTLTYSVLCPNYPVLEAELSQNDNFHEVLQTCAKGCLFSGG